MGRSSGAVPASPSGERSSVSPDISAFSPATQPRQLISAITMVMRATTAAMPAKSHSTYFFVSALRRSTKLMSCTIIRLPSGPESPATGFAETCSGPSFNCSTQLRASLSPGGGQRTVCGQVGLANARWPVRSQSPMAKMRSPCMMRSK